MPDTSNLNETLIYRCAIHFRISDDDPGIRDYEYSLIELLVKITHGTIFKLNKTGTNLYFQLGLLHGGDIEHECCTQRGIGYYLEVVIMLSLFCKVCLKAKLRGVTSSLTDSSVDHIKASLIPMLKRFVVDDEGIDLRITKRGMLPKGGGEVIFTCPVKNEFKSIKLFDSGMIGRITGTAYALHTLPTIPNRLVAAAEIILLTYFPDVHINIDQCGDIRSDKSPGYGIHIYAETSSGLIYSSEAVSTEITEDFDLFIPESLGADAAKRLRRHIQRGGCNDPATQALAIIYMALGEINVSKLVIRALADSSRWLLRYLRDFFEVNFTFENIPSDGHPLDRDKTLLSCIGTGYLNNCR